MKIHPQDIGAIYAAFIDNEVSPKASSGVQKFMAYMSVFAIQKQAQDYITHPKRMEQMKSMGIMDEQGLIDADYLKEMATYAMKKSGGTIEAMGLLLSQSDIDTMYSLARSFAK